MTNRTSRSVYFTLGLMLAIFIATVNGARAEEFRKWSPKGQEPFYGKLIGYSPEETEVVIEKHGENRKSVRIPISSITGADAKLVKDFIARSQSTTGRPDFSKPSVEDRGNDRWNLNPIISLSLPDRAAGWRLTSKSPLTFVAVGLEDNKKQVLSTIITPPLEDDKAFEKYSKQLMGFVEKQLRQQGVKDLPSNLELQEAKSVNGFNKDRMYEAKSPIDSSTLLIRVFSGQDATVAFVALGSDEEVTQAMECTTKFTYQTQANSFFRTPNIKSPTAKSPTKSSSKAVSPANPQSVSQLKGSVGIFTAMLKKRDKKNFFALAIDPEDVAKLKKEGQYESAFTDFDEAKMVQLQKTLEGIQWETAKQEGKDKISVESSASNRRISFRRINDGWRMQN